MDGSLHDDSSLSSLFVYIVCIFRYDVVMSTNYRNNAKLTYDAKLNYDGCNCYGNTDLCSAANNEETFHQDFLVILKLCFQNY